MIKKLPLIRLFFSKQSQNNPTFIAAESFGKNAKRLCFVLFLFVNYSFGQTNTWDGSSSTAWDNRFNWSLNVVPTAAHNVVIPNVTRKPIISVAGAVCATLTINNTGTGSNTLTINSPGTLIVSGAVTLTSPTGNTRNTIIDVVSGVLSAASISLTDGNENSRDASLRIGTGAVNVTGSITMAGNASRNDITFSGAGTLNIGGTISGGALTPSTGTVNYNNAGSQAIGLYSYNNLTLSGSGTKTFGAATTVSGNWSMVSGVLANLGTFTHSAGTLVLGGAGPLLNSWGSTTSGATNTTNDYFSNTGRINVTLAAPYPAIDNNYATYSNGISGQVAGTSGEYSNPPTNTLPGSLTLTAPTGAFFTNVKFASYGSPGGTSPDFTIGTCHAFNSRTVTTGLLGTNTSQIPNSGSFNNTFGDPCYGIVKSYNVVATYAEPYCTISPVPAILIDGSTPTGGNGTYTYLWERSTTGHSTGYTAAPGINNAEDYTVSSGTTQTTWYRRTVTSGIYSDATIVIVQVVTTAPTAPTTITAPQTICAGQSATLSVSGGSLGGPTGYAEWTSGSCNGPVVGTGNSITVTPTSNTTYFVKYRNACGVTSCLSTTVSNSVYIVPAANAAQVCYSTSVQTTPLTYSGTTGTPTAYSIVWNAVPANSFVAVTNAALSASPILISVPANTPAGTYTGTITVRNAGGCVSYGNNFTVTVSATSTTSNAGPDQSANTTSFALAANSPTVGTGIWSIANGPNTSLSQFSNTTSPTSTFTPIVAGTYVLNWTITNGSCSSSDQVVIANNCVNNMISNGDFSNGGTNWTFATSQGSYIEINPENTYFSNSNNDSTAELDLQASLRQVLSVIPGVSYTVSFVYARRLTADTPATTGVTVKITGGSSDITSTGFTTTSTTPQIGSFTFTPTSSSIGVEFYNTLHGGATLGTIIDNIILIPTSQVAPYATTTPKGVFKTSTSCAGVPVQLDVDNVPASGVTYAWTGPAGAVFSSTNIKNPTVTFSGSGVQGATVTVTTSTGCSGTSTTYVDVTATRTISGPTASSVCSGSTYSSGAITSIGTTFDWSRAAVANINGGAAGAGGINVVNATGFSEILTNSTSSPINVTYVLTPKSASGCSGTPYNLVVTVNPRPTIANMTTNLCSGSSFTVVPVNGTNVVPSGTTYTWSAPVVAGITGTASGTNAANISGTLTNTTDAAINVVYTVTPTSGVCTGSTFTVTVTVNPRPPAPALGTITHISCTSNTGSVVLGDLPSGNWTINQTGFATASYSNTIANTTSTTISGLAAGSYTFTVTNTSGCTSAALTTVAILDNSNTWNGSSWSKGVPPNASMNVIIASVAPSSPFTVDLEACALTINNGVVATVPSGITLTITNEVAVYGQLTFENNASLVQINDLNNNIGPITYKRNSQPMKNFDYTYWSSPVEGQTFNNFSPNTLWDKYLSYTGTGWQEELGSSVMEPGIGYIIRVPKPNSVYPNGKDYWTGSSYTQQVEFIGRPNNGNITSNQYMEKDKYYLIGNPYPSAIHADDFLYSNAHNRGILGGTVYLWTHNTAIKKVDSKLAYVSDDYASYNLTGGTATRPALSPGANTEIPEGYIAAGQSFFASAEDGSGNVEFTNSMRYGATHNSQFFKPGRTSRSAGLEKHRLWLNMTNSGGAYKQTLIGYVQGATNSFDGDYDGLTFDGNSYIDFYSVNASDNLTIQGRGLPFTDTDVVPLGYRSAIAGNFTIAIDKADGNLSTQRVYLEDKQTGTINELTAGNYTFATKAGTFNNRFVLRYTNKTLGTGDFETTEDAVWVVIQNKTVTINSTVENIDKVFVYDISGKQLYSKDDVKNLQLIMHDLPFAQQVLLVKVVLENGYQTTKKVIFK